MSVTYTLAAFAVVPGLLGLFHWLSRVPKPPASEVKLEEKPTAEMMPASLADEAERWLQSQV